MLYLLDRDQTGTAAGAALGAVGSWTHKALLAGSWGIIRGWSVLLVCVQICTDVLRIVLATSSQSALKSLG